MHCSIRTSAPVQSLPSYIFFCVSQQAIHLPANATTIITAAATFDAMTENHAHQSAYPHLSGNRGITKALPTNSQMVHQRRDAESAGSKLNLQGKHLGYFHPHNSSIRLRGNHGKHKYELHHVVIVPPENNDLCGNRYTIKIPRKITFYDKPYPEIVDSLEHTHNGQDQQVVYP